MTSLLAEAEALITEAETRALTAKAAGLTTGKAKRHNDSEALEWRSLIPGATELRALIAEGTPGDGGYTVPQNVAKTYVDKLRARSVFLRAPGLNVIEFDGGSFRLPALTAASEPGVTPEGATIAEGDTDWIGHDFAPFKFATLYRASNEILTDSNIPLRDVIADTMIRETSVKIDKDAFASAVSGTIKGLTATGQHIKNALTAGNTAVKWDHVVEAVADIEGQGGLATVVWASPDMAKGLRKERENGATGAYLSGSVTGDPASTAQGLPLLVSANLPVRSVIVADATRIFFGVHNTGVRLKSSEDAYFESDTVGFRLTYRVAGLAVAEAASVSGIQASAT